MVLLSEITFHYSREKGQHGAWQDDSFPLRASSDERQLAVQTGTWKHLWPHVHIHKVGDRSLSGLFRL